MTFDRFVNELKAEGLTYAEILKANTIAYEEARDAHDGLDGSWTDADLNSIGRDFVITNLDDFLEQIRFKG